MTYTLYTTWVDKNKPAGKEPRHQPSGETLLQYQRDWRDNTFMKMDKIIIPMQVQLDHRLTDTEKILAGFFYTNQRSTLPVARLAALIGRTSSASVKPCIRKLKQCGYIRSYLRPTTQQGWAVYEWIGTNSRLRVDNEYWTAERSAELARRFL